MQEEIEENGSNSELIIKNKIKKKKRINFGGGECVIKDLKN